MLISKIKQSKTEATLICQLYQKLVDQEWNVAVCTQSNNDSNPKVTSPIGKKNIKGIDKEAHLYGSGKGLYITKK